MQLKCTGPIKMKFNFKDLSDKALEISSVIKTELPVVKNSLNDSVDFVVKNTVDNVEVKEFASKAQNQLNRYSSQVIENVDAMKNKYIPAKEVVEEGPGKEINDVINKLNKKDKIGVAGEGLSAMGGAAAGVVASGGVASAAGVSTLFGSTTLASTLGGVFVTATPIGWVIGSAAVAGIAGYSIAKMVRSGSEQDQVRKGVVARLKERLDLMQSNQEDNASLDDLNQLLPIAIMNGLIDESQAKKMLNLIDKGALNVDMAVQRIEAMILSSVTKDD